VGAITLSGRLADLAAQREERRADLIAALRLATPAQEERLLQLVQRLHAARRAERAAGNVLTLRPAGE